MNERDIETFAARILRRQPCAILLDVDTYHGCHSVSLAPTENYFEPFVGCGHTGLAHEDIGDVTAEAIGEIVSYALQWSSEDERRAALARALSSGP